MIIEANQTRESIGQELRRLREHRGWTVEFVAKLTKIKPEQIEEIEADNYVNFPSVAYVRGFVRIYAKALGLDDRKVVAKLDGKLMDEEPSLVPMSALEALGPVKKVKESAPKRVGSTIIGLFVLIALLGVIAFIWSMGGKSGYLPPNTATNRMVNVPRAEPLSPTPEVKEPKQQPKAVRPAIPVATPVETTPTAVAVPVAPRAEPLTPQAIPATPTAQPTPQPNAPRAEIARPTATLTLEATGDVWLKVILNGNEEEPVFNSLVTVGQTLTWEGQNFFIEARPSSNLLVTLNGTRQGPLGKGGAQVEQFNLP